MTETLLPEDAMTAPPQAEGAGPQNFPTPDREQVRLAFESGSYPYSRPMGVRD